MNRLPMIIVVGPSGVGKSSFVDKIIEEDSNIKDIITYTTRAMRKGESEGNPYHFVTEERFRALESDQFFVETANVHGRFYGTPKDQIEKTMATPGEAVIMDIDIQGARVFQSKYPGCLTIFIHPPNLDELRHRVISREGKPPEDLEVRMETAKKELQVADEFEKQMTNTDFAPSYAEFKKIVEDYLKSI